MKRGTLKIPMKIIYNEKIRAKKSRAKFPILQMLFNANVYGTPATTWIYGNKIVLIVWSDNPVATLIQSKDIADSYRQFFSILWKDSKK